MRLLVTLQSQKSAAYDMAYYHKLRGFLYGLQKGSVAFNRHNLDGYKLFCFSNIFPPKDMRHGERRTLIVSSPSSDFIYWLRGRFSEMQETGWLVEVGEMQFSIEAVKSFTPRLGRRARLITGTPVVMRIPRSRYAGYGITSQRPYEFWRPQYDFNAFLKQLNGNLVKKYNQYYNENIRDTFLFEEFEFKKSVAVPRVEAGREQTTIGTLWEFGFSHLGDEQRKVLQLGLDAGFGELNSSGFGFVSVV